MTESGDKEVINLLHAIEVRFTERLTRIEAEASAWRTTHNELRIDIERVSTEAKDAARALALTQAADSLRTSDRIQNVSDQNAKSEQRLTIGLVIVAMAAVGRMAVNLFQYFSG